MKIMRRNDGDRPSAEGSVAASSSVPSKNPSEAGDSGPEGDRAGSSTDAKDRLALTREEREAKYQEVRERIFRDFPESAKSDSGDLNPNISRSSSTGGRKKNNRQRTPHDDSFEARSQFNAYYPGMPYNNGQSLMSYNDASYSSQPVPYLVGPGVPPPTSGYMPAGQNNAMPPGQMGGMNHIPQYPMAMSPQMASNGSWQGGSMPQQSPYSGYASMNQSGMMNQQSPSHSSPAMNNFAMANSAQYQQNFAWGSPPYSGNYQQSPQRNQPPVHWPNYPSQSMTSNMAAYPYAQYPGQHLNPALQNPGSPILPGDYARSHFNPQIRSFIPGGVQSSRNPSRGAQNPMQPFTGMPPQGQWAGYPEPAHNRGMDHPSAASAARVPNSGRDSIAKWGTPSHLPPKPPPSEMKSGFDMKHRVGPPLISAPTYPGNGIPGTQNGPLVISGGANVSRPT